MNSIKFRGLKIIDLSIQRHLIFISLNMSVKVKFTSTEDYRIQIQGDSERNFRFECRKTKNRRFL